MFGQMAYSREQKRMLEEKGSAFGEARELYNRRLWDLTEVLSRYGKRKREICELLVTLPAGCKSQKCQQILERSLFALQEGRGDERSGLTGAALREWSRRDLSFPDIENLKPSEAFELYDRLCGNLTRDARRLEAMPGPIQRWIDSAGALMQEVRRRLDQPQRARSVSSLLALYLDAEIFQKEGAGYVLREKELTMACDAIDAAVAAVISQRQKASQ